jgi:hypothetical protein
MTNDAHGGRFNRTGVTCAEVPEDVEGKQAVWIFTELEAGESLKTLRDWLIPDHGAAHLAGWDGQRFELGREDRAADRRCGAGTDCAHDRAHDADDEGAIGRLGVSITDLTRVEEKAATIPLLELIVTPSIIRKVGQAYVTVQAETIKFPPGFHEGSLVAGTGSKQAPALCVSHAQLARN